MIAVAYDVTSLAENPHAGIARVCHHILEQAVASPIVEPTALIRRGDPANVASLGSPVRLRRVGWTARFRPAAGDIVHALGHRVPPVRARKLVYTLHDAWSLYPNRFQSPGFQRKIGPRMRRELRRADSVVCDSGATRDKLLELDLVDPSRCHVALCGVARPSAEPVGETATPLGELLPRRFVLFVGRIEVRKNLEHVIEAVLPVERAKLVIVGEAGYGAEKITTATLSRLPSDRLVHLRQIPEDQLDWLYRHALAVLLPSWEEGFGLPILEAMIRGCPVVTSNCSGSAEVGSDAAILVDPTAPSQSRRVLERLLDDPDFRSARVADGLVRAGSFSWEKSFESLLEVYRDVLG